MKNQNDIIPKILPIYGMNAKIKATILPDIITPADLPKLRFLKLRIPVAICKKTIPMKKTIKKYIICRVNISQNSKPKISII